ncbi:LysR family transcriptional regulator [Pseudomonas eucalypticola]|uniref:LysR family transcriptional regulator n=1 Tax=Pseudomonas eucalypticola TaxID=2599595 RepID=A0A7D5D5Q8_9PSED|nr:LysR family transcriptional regulator [Pseudomonas eucalypticola]QKZ03075.1 LysR family transcriptional regulator [Pseudomonas eucalypticola]
MRRFDLDLLHTLTVVAEAGTLSAAAERLHRSQSAVSEQLQKLEAFCGQQLFSRSKRGTRLTPMGERLLAHARQLLDLNEQAFHDMRGTRLSGDLRLLITDYFRPNAIAPLLKRLTDRYPGLRLHVTIRKSAMIEAQPDDFDIGLYMQIVLEDTPAPAEGVEAVRNEKLQWVVAEHLLQDRPATLPLVILPATCSLQGLALNILQRARQPYLVAHSASGVAGLQSALSAGLGVACLNESSIPPGVVPVPAHWQLPALPSVQFRARVNEHSGSLARDVLSMLRPHLV